MVLRGENVARAPAHVRAEFHQRLDEHGGLDRHVQRTDDAHPFEGFVGGVFLADGDQAGHFFLGDVEFLAAEVGERDVADGVV